MDKSHPDQVLEVSPEAEKITPAEFAEVIEFARLSGADINMGAIDGAWYVWISQKGMTGHVWIWTGEDGSAGSSTIPSLAAGTVIPLFGNEEIREAIKKFGRV